MEHPNPGSSVSLSVHDYQLITLDLEIIKLSMTLTAPLNDVGAGRVYAEKQLGQEAQVERDAER